MKDRRLAPGIGSIRQLLLIFVSIVILLLSTSAFAINVLVVGGPSTGNQATNQLFANGDLTGTVARPTWDEYRNMTTHDIVNNYDVMVITYDAVDWQWDMDWNTRILPFLASGGGVVWNSFIVTGTGGSPLITLQHGTRYVCPDGSICYIPNSSLNPDVPLNILAVPGLTDGLGSAFTQVGGYFNSWDPALQPFLQVNATGLGTITYGVYGGVNAGRTVITQLYADRNANSTGSAAEQNTYLFLKNAITWSGASTLPPDPNLRFIPNLINVADADARTAITDIGLVVDPFTFYQPTNWYLPGVVWSQSPNPGDGAFVGDSVMLTINPLPTGAPVTVPDLTGMTYDEADTALTAVNLQRSCCISGPSATVPAGQIIVQYPRPGTTSTEGWTVDVLMSDGPATTLPDGTVSTPGLKLMNQAEAEASITASGFTVGNVIQQNHPTIAAGTVIDSTSGNLALGSPIDITISAGPAGTTLVTVPDVVGQTQADAEANLTAAGLVPSATTAFSDTVAAGLVISQTPAATTEVAENSTVTIVVSAGPAPVVVVVPDVLGATQADAESAIISAGLVVGTVTQASSATVPAGSVISENPTAGTELDAGSAVDLVVSTGPALVAVPSVTGIAEADAETAIIAAGLTVGTVTSQSSNTVAAGVVISQNPASGTEVSEGSAVDLVVSSGPELVTVPGVVGLTYTSAQTAIANAGLTVGSVSTVLTRRSCGIVRSQSPSGGANVAAGTAVDLVVTRTRRCNPL